jgi:hypothetical protein
MIDGVYSPEQVTEELEVAQQTAKYEAMSEKQISKEIKRIELRLERAKQDDVPDQVKRLEDRLAELKAAAKSGKPEKTAGTILDEDQIAAVVRQAYLRTLSREPSVDEQRRCQDYLAEAATPIEGIRGLLWTLINTKEFIVNH